MPASNVTRVRSDGFWNSIASVRPVSGGSACRRVSRNSLLSASAVPKTRSTSAADRVRDAQQVAPAQRELAGVMVATVIAASS